ncbi:MAG: hypothetical protein M3Y84_06555, partial [Acidobacteriota bacterium]|nr:hypothetical protein [Acidobacteriota bacterium]
KYGAALVVAEMVTFLITSVFILAIVVVAIYFWQQPTSATETQALLPRPESRGMFDDFDRQTLAELDGEFLAETSHQSAALRDQLLSRAKAGEKGALEDARNTGDPAVYEDALNVAIARADSGAQLLSLVSYVSRHELPVNKNLAERFIDSCRVEPDRISIIKMLHVAALADEAETYQRAVETGLEFWRQGFLAQMSAQELRSILEGEFWILSSRTRSSGAGFILKRTLASARRELQPVQNE